MVSGKNRTINNRMNVWSVIHFIAMYFALYLSFKRNNGINWNAFFAALIFPEIYIIYTLAVPLKY